MHKNHTRAVVAGILAVAMLAPTVANVAPSLNVSAGQVLGETTFDHKALPWHTSETSPAKQELSLEDGAACVTVLVPEGGEKSKWDLQFRCRNLNFKANHVYKVSFDAKSNREGMELCSKIGNIGGDLEYFELDGNTNDMHMGPNMGGSWGSAVKLSTSYKTFSGTFTPTSDLEGVEWCFHYAKDSNGYGGNAQEGDKIWFDNMSIECTTCDECDADPNATYGRTNRDFSTQVDPTMLKDGKLVNFISVNQIGYYSNLAKTATLGDNQGDVLYGATKIDLTENSYEFELVNAESDEVVYTGTTSAKFADKDSGDNVCKIDFTEYNTPGRYYLRIKGQDWRSMAFNIGDNIYSDDSHDMLTNAMNYYYQNRSGIAIESDYITSGDKTTLAHQGGHFNDTASVQKGWKNEYSSADEATGSYASSKIEATGGWYDAGDHGKYVVNGGISVWTLQNMYERAIQTEDGTAKFADGSGTVVIPENGNDIPDILDETAYELDWMSKMVVQADEPTWGKYAGMVYHKLHDHKWTGLATRPWNYETEWGTVRIVKPPTFAATLNYAACAAQAARLWQPYDEEKAKGYLEAAKTSYQAYLDNYYEAGADEENNETSLYAPLYQAKGGGAYGDNQVTDDAYWAACEIFVSAKEMGDETAASQYQTELEKYGNAYKVTTRVTGGENKDGSLTTFNWGNTASAGSLTLALHEDLLSPAQQETVESSILEAADTYIDTESDQGYGIPYLYDGPGYTDPTNLPEDVVIKGYEWGSNSMVINNSIVMAYAYDMTKENKYMDGVATAMNYLLGCNPLSFSYITGYGTYKVKNPHHRFWSYELDKTLPMAPDGILSGGPNAGLQDPFVRALGFVSGLDTNPSQRCYVDSIEAWSVNEVTINWNAPLAWIVSFLQDEAAKAGESQPTTKDPNAPTEEPTTKPAETTQPSTEGYTEGTTAAATVAPTIPPEEVQGLLGDADVDTDVDVADVVKILSYTADKEGSPLSGQGLYNADCYDRSQNAEEWGTNATDKPWDINSSDAAAVAKFVAKTNSSLPETWAE